MGDERRGQQMVDSAVIPPRVAEPPEPPSTGASLDFGAALGMVRAGGRAARAGWNGKGMWIALSPGFELFGDQVFSEAVAKDINQGTGVFRPYLIMKTVDGEYVPWVASQTDILAVDWQPAP